MLGSVLSSGASTNEALRLAAPRSMLGAWSSVSSRLHSGSSRRGGDTRSSPTSWACQPTAAWSSEPWSQPSCSRPNRRHLGNEDAGIIGQQGQSTQRDRLDALATLGRSREPRPASRFRVSCGLAAGSSLWRSRLRRGPGTPTNQADPRPTERGTGDVLCPAANRRWRSGHPVAGMTSTSTSGIVPRRTRAASSAG